MKKIFLSLVLISISVISFGQWNTNGTSTFYNGGRVGIGIDNPVTLLEIKGEHVVGHGLLSLNSSSSYSFLELNAGGDLPYAGIYFSSNETHEMSLYWNPEDKAMNFTDGTNSNDVKLSIEQNGNIGIGTGRAALSEKLEVNGNILIKEDNGLILTSPNGTKFKITVDDNGNLTTSQATSSKSLKVNYDVDIFPNPTENKLTISVKDQNIHGLDAEIYDLTGKRIFRKNYSTNDIKINTSNLSSGTYLIKLKDSDGNLIKTEKFIKQ